jgi:hypothetical protein
MAATSAAAAAAAATESEELGVVAAEGGAAAPARTISALPAHRAASFSTTSMGGYAKSSGKKNSATHLAQRKQKRGAWGEW